MGELLLRSRDFDGRASYGLEEQSISICSRYFLPGLLNPRRIFNFQFGEITALAGVFRGEGGQKRAGEKCSLMFDKWVVVVVALRRRLSDDYKPFTLFTSLCREKCLRARRRTQYLDEY